MRVGIGVTTYLSPSDGETYVQASVYVHGEVEIIGSKVLYQYHRREQVPADDTNLNLWTIALLRGLVSNMETDFVYTDHRPEAVLIKDVIEDKI